MGKSRKIVRFDYCKLVCETLESGDTQSEFYDVRKLLDKDKLPSSLEKRIYDFGWDGEYARVDKMSRVSGESNYYVYSFTKLYRDMSLGKAKLTELVKAIPLDKDEYLGADITMVYNATAEMYMLQRNQNSLTINQLALALTTILGTPNKTLHFQPIAKQANIKTIETAEELRSVALTVRVPYTSNAASVGEGIDKIDDFNAEQVAIKWSVGRKRHASLSKDAILRNLPLWIGQIATPKSKENEDDEYKVEKLEMQYREDTAGDIEIIDFVKGLQSSFIEFDLPDGTRLSSEFCQKEMVKEFKKKLPTIRELK